MITAGDVSLIENVETAILSHPVTGFDVVAFVVDAEAPLLAAACGLGAHGTICLEGTQWARISGSVEVMPADTRGRRDFRDEVMAALGSMRTAERCDDEAVVVIIHPEHAESRKTPARKARRAHRQPVLVGAGQ